MILELKGLYENKSQYEADLTRRQQEMFEREKQYGVDRDYRDMQINEELAHRMLPLNELNALRTGISQPLFTPTPYQGTNIGAPPLFDAGIAQGNADQQDYNRRSQLISDAVQGGSALAGWAGAKWG